MNGRIKIAMVLGTLIILIIGVSCITGEVFTNNDAQHYKHQSTTVDKIDNSSFEKVSVEKIAPADSSSVKKGDVEQSSKNLTQSNAVSTQNSSKNAKSQDVSVKNGTVKNGTMKNETVKKVAVKNETIKNESVKKVDEKSDVKKDTIREEDKIINGWNPKDHEVSREDIGDGLQRVTYDDGYYRIVDQDGNIISYGYETIN